MSSQPNTTWPHDEEGRPMAILSASCSDTVPTVQYGSVKLFASVSRPVVNGSHQDLINETRALQRDIEFCVGVEGRRLIQALNPEYKITHPITGEHVFSSPPDGYDPASMPPHPGDAANAKPVESAKS